MKRYKDVLVFVGTLIILAFVWLFFRPQSIEVVSNLLPLFFLFVVIALIPLALKRNSNEPRSKILLIMAGIIVVLVGGVLAQTFSLGPIPLLISLMVGAILLSISLQIKTKTPSEPFET